MVLTQQAESMAEYLSLSDFHQGAVVRIIAANPPTEQVPSSLPNTHVSKIHESSLGFFFLLPGPG
jgi:hypothetical protein